MVDYVVGRVNEEDIFTAVTGMFEQCRGGYACVAMIAGINLILFNGWLIVDCFG